MWKFAVTALVLVACETEKPVDAASSAPTPSVAMPKLCEAAQAMQTRLAPIDVKVSRTALDPTMALPESKHGARAPEGSVVSFGKSGMTVDGQDAATPNAVVGALNERSGERPVLLAIDKGDADLARLLAVADALGPSVQLYLLATPPGGKHEPPPAALAKELEGLRPGERAGVLANALRAAIKDCKPAADLFQSLASQALPDERASMLKEGLPRAVNECGCKVGPELGDLAAYVLGGDRITVAKRLTLTNEGKAIALKGLNGQALYDALPADGGAVRFEK